MSTASGTPGPEVDTQPGKKMDLSRVTQHENLVGRERKTGPARTPGQSMALSTWGERERMSNTFSGLDTGTWERLSHSAEVLLSNTRRYLSEHKEKDLRYENKDKYKVKSRV